jgi:hypothetical protein
MTLDKRVRRPTRPPAHERDIAILARSTAAGAQAFVVDGDHVDEKRLSTAELGALVASLIERMSDAQFTILIDREDRGGAGRSPGTNPPPPVGPGGEWTDRLRAVTTRLQEIARPVFEDPAFRDR